LPTKFKDYTITNIEFETFTSTHHCSWFYPVKTRSVSVINNTDLLHCDDNTNTVVHKKGSYSDRLQLKDESSIIITDPSSPLQRELEHFRFTVYNGTQESINGLSHIERVYRNLELVGNAHLQ